MDNCADCSVTPSECETCRAGFVDDGNKLCVDCIGDCKTCSGGFNICATCNDVHAHTNSPSPGCGCNVGYFDEYIEDGVVTCAECHRDCEECLVKDKCT